MYIYIVNTLRRNIYTQKKLSEEKHCRVCWSVTSSKIKPSISQGKQNFLLPFFFCSSGTKVVLFLFLLPKQERKHPEMVPC